MEFKEVREPSKAKEHKPGLLSSSEMFTRVKIKGGVWGMLAGVKFKGAVAKCDAIIQVLLK